MPLSQAVIASHSCNEQAVNIHIDWIHIYAPCHHKPTGTLLYFDDDSLDQLVPSSATANQKAIKDGGKKAYIRSKEINGRTGMASMIEIQCCPPKILQKHNLFGHANLQDYVYTILDLVTKRLHIEVEADDRLNWKQGNVTLTGIHLTANFKRPAGMSVPIIQAIDENNECGKRRPLPSWITLDRGKERRSTFNVLTIYDKMQEMLSHSEWKKPGHYQTKLLAEADRGIRVELKLFSQSLKHHDLGYVSRWRRVDIPALYFEYLDKYRLRHTIQRLLTDDEMASLKRSQRTAYSLWLNGMDIKDQYCRTTAWQLTKDILDQTGIDIGGKRRPEKLPGIDLRDIFTSENVLPVPDWAIGTTCYAAPRGYGISSVPVNPNAAD